MRRLSPNSILNSSDHRLYPYPRRPWLLFQSWRNVVFMHWPVEPDIVAPHIPKGGGLKLDTYDGKAWLSLVGFTVAPLRLRFLPPIPFFSTFHELNLRTYATDGHKPGAVFLNIAVNKLLPAAFHRLAGLPYHHSFVDLKDSVLKHQSGDVLNRNVLSVRWQQAARITEKTPLDRWLTDRFCTYQRNGNHTYRFPIHHADWELHPAELRSTPIISFKWNNIALSHRNLALVHYSPGVDTLFWNKERVD